MLLQTFLSFKHIILAPAVGEENLKKKINYEYKKIQIKASHKTVEYNQ
jgi:hypothetical protein